VAVLLVAVLPEAVLPEAVLLGVTYQPKQQMLLPRATCLLGSDAEVPRVEARLLVARLLTVRLLVTDLNQVLKADPLEGEEEPPINNTPGFYSASEGDTDIPPPRPRPKAKSNSRAAAEAEIMRPSFLPEQVESQTEQSSVEEAPPPRPPQTVGFQPPGSRIPSLGDGVIAAKKAVTGWFDEQTYMPSSGPTGLEHIFAPPPRQHSSSSAFTIQDIPSSSMALPVQITYGFG